MPRRHQEEIETESRGAAVAAVIVRHPRETVGIVMATAATLAIFINALFLQHGPHPAPIFASHALMHSVRKIPLPHARVAPPPAHAIPVPSPAPPPSQDQKQLVEQIQRELSRKGFYDGAVDGVWGVKTNAAVRAFEDAAGLTLETQPSANLLRKMKTSTVHAQTSGAAATTRDPIANLLAPASTPQSNGPAVSSARVLAVQRALAEFGYGQIKPTGVIDADTRAAIEKFEKGHGLPVTGRYSEPLVQALSAMSGRPLE